jgi:hypothetical protein
MEEKAVVETDIQARQLLEGLKKLASRELCKDVDRLTKARVPFCWQPVVADLKEVVDN